MELIEPFNITMEQYLALESIAAGLKGIPENYDYPYVSSDLYSKVWFENIDSCPWTQDPAAPTIYYEPWNGIPGSGQISGWGPFTITGGDGTPSYLQFGIYDFLEPSSLSEQAWTTAEKNAIKDTFLPSNSPGYRLTGFLLSDRELLPSFPEKNIIYSLELSGWGYVPSGGFSFRKTHTRHSSTSCPYPGRSVSTTLPDPVDLPVTLPPLDRPELDNPPYEWDYPDSLPLPDNYALFQRGSLAPYYPLYGSAAVYDLLLQKWGMYNNQHKLIQELMPVNRIDSSIMPVADKGMFAGALTPLGQCTIFKDRNPQSRITYGKMAFYRRGMSLATGAIAHFGAIATGTLIVEASMDGVTIDPLLSYAMPFVDQRNVTLPFTTRAKWFNIRVEGNFNLTYLELLAEGRGRR